MNPDDKTALEQALRGLDYPAPRNKLIEMAKINNASRHVIERLQELPETADFQNADRLREALGVDVPGVRSHEWE
jgi:hypothetical protein